MSDAVSNPTLNVPDRKYDCIDCGRCCRDWHVELSKAEVDSLAGLAWTSDDLPAKRTVRFHGKTFIAHRQDGTCIYFDAEKKRCMIHAQFSYDAKPLGCRLYPFNLASDGNDCISVAGRFDCPAIRGNEGMSFKRRHDEFKLFAAEVGVKPHRASELDLDGLLPSKANEIVNALLRYIVNNDKLPMTHALMLGQMAIARIRGLSVAFINDMELSEIFPSFFVRLTQDHGIDKPRRLGGLEQARFLSLLLSFLRRDEEQLGGVGGRLGRVMTLFKVLRGEINLNGLSKDYPDYAMSRTSFFSIPVLDPDDLEGRVVMDLIGHRLETRQFFGPSTYDRGLFFGLQSLFMLGGLALALAKWLAIAREGGLETCRITATDLDLAVGAVDHPYGRSPLLGLGFMNTLQRQVCNADAFKRIVSELVGGTPA